MIAFKNQESESTLRRVNAMGAPKAPQYEFQAKETSGAGPSRQLDIYWAEDDMSIEVELVTRGYFPVARSYRVTCDSGVSKEGRRFPTDRQLVASVERHPEGRYFLSWLISEVKPDGSTAEESQLEAWTRLLASDHWSRAGTDMENLRFIFQMLNAGEKTNDVVRFLEWRGVSRATAFRTLSRVREAQVLSETK